MRLWYEPLQWVAEWRRRRLWIMTGARLDPLRQRALHAADERSRVAAIDGANTLLARLEACGAVTTAKRIELGRDWVRAYAMRRAARALSEEGCDGRCSDDLVLKGWLDAEAAADLHQPLHPGAGV